MKKFSAHMIILRNPVILKKLNYENADLVVLAMYAASFVKFYERKIY